jgi:hypothetical protein
MSMRERIFLAIVFWPACPLVAATPNGVATPLTSIGAVSDPDAAVDLDDPGTGGSFDSTTYFRNRLTSPAAIAACASSIQQVAAAWASKFTFSESFREMRPNGLTLQYVKVGVKGLFEFTYRVQFQTRARVTLNYYAQDGSLLEPSAIQTLLSRYSIGPLEDSLDSALRCGRQGV